CKHTKFSKRFFEETLYGKSRDPVVLSSYAAGSRCQTGHNRIEAVGDRRIEGSHQARAGAAHYGWDASRILERGSADMVYKTWSLGLHAQSVGQAWLCAG